MKMTSKSTIVLSFIAVFVCFVIDAFQIASFNVQIYGDTKAANKKVVQHLKEIMKDYEIIGMQELRDSTGEDALEILVNALNECDVKGCKYDFVLSPRLGRTRSKEQYVFLYRTSKVSLSEALVFDDTAGDKFEREPFVVKAKIKRGTLDSFSIVLIHVKPEDAVAEISALVGVADWVVQKHQTKDVLIMGDFNAGCDYVRKKDWPKIALWTDSRFHWHITNDADTTVKDSHCPYDRFITTGPTLSQAVKSVSIRRFDLPNDLNLTQSKAAEISDHYPIVIELRTSGLKHDDL